MIFKGFSFLIQKGVVSSLLDLVGLIDSDLPDRYPGPRTGFPDDSSIHGNDAAKRTSI